MISVYCLVCGLLTAISVYLLLSTQMPRWLFGSMLLGSTINLILFLVGRIHGTYPAFIKAPFVAKHMSNPLPQALVLTAIVIGFGLFAFSIALLRRMNQLSIPLTEHIEEQEGTHD